MTDRIALMLEAERRGILPPDKAALLAKRADAGLCPDRQRPISATSLPEPPRFHRSVGFVQRPVVCAFRQCALMPPPRWREVNAANARYRNSPQAAIDAQAEAAQQQRLKKAQFDAMPAPLRYAIGAGASLIAAREESARDCVGAGQARPAKLHRRIDRRAADAAGCGQTGGGASSGWRPVHGRRCRSRPRQVHRRRGASVRASGRAFGQSARQARHQYRDGRGPRLLQPVT